MQSERVVLAEISRPRGNRGELLALSQTDVPNRLKNLRRAWLRLRDGSDLPVEISEAWEHKKDWVLKFAGIDSIDQADRFRGAELWLPFEQRGQLPDGEVFRSDLIGCLVVNRLDCQNLGTVRDVHQYGGPLLLEVAAAGSREVLIPFVPEICHTVDLEERIIQVELPEGLMEL